MQGQFLSLHIFKGVLHFATRPFVIKLVQLCACRDVVVHHEEVEFFFSLFCVFFVQTYSYSRNSLSSYARMLSGVQLPI